jgi:hypothetical protein
MVKRIPIRKGITVKMPLSQLESKTVVQRVREHLQRNVDDGYTISGLLVELYDYSPTELNGPFKSWPKGAPSQYTRIRHALEDLKAKKLVQSIKHEKAYFYFWKPQKE